MSEEVRPGRILIVLNPDFPGDHDPLATAIIRRSMAVCQRTGCELELLMAGAPHLWTAGPSAETIETQLTALVNRLRVVGLKARFDVCRNLAWDIAIPRKAAESKPGFVMLPTSLCTVHDVEYLSTVLSAHRLWMVGSQERISGTALAAFELGTNIGNHPGNGEAVLRTAVATARCLDMNVHLMSTYALSNKPLINTLTHADNFSPVSKESRHLKRRAQRLATTSRYLGVPVSNIHLRQSALSDAIDQTANEVDAQLLVLDADDLRVIANTAVNGDNPSMSNRDLIIVGNGDSATTNRIRHSSRLHHVRNPVLRKRMPGCSAPIMISGGHGQQTDRRFR